jgi:transcriptional regulator with PAS, ATPase and Fis domain
LPKIIGESNEIKKLKELIVKIANDKDVSVMIYGESGTGKELVAEYIHSKSERSQFPFIPINCAALPNDLLESELFGHVKGSFTGALQDKKGLIQAADKGTLFLDEVSEMSPGLQSKLLRVLQERKVQPIGSTENIEVDIRVVGASNIRLENLIEENKFREDLFYRLNVVELIVPPLRDRCTDIPLIIDHLINKFKNDRSRLNLEQDTLSLLQNYPFPGNVRELENIVRGLYVTSNSGKISPNDLPIKLLKNSSMNMPTQTYNDNYHLELQKVIENFEVEFLLYHLKRNKGNISQTADEICLSRVSLHKKIKQYNLNVNFDLISLTILYSLYLN